MLVVPATEIERLAAACTLVRVDATVVPLDGSGAGVVLEDAREAVAAAGRLSRVLGQLEVSLFVRGQDQVEASTWRGGSRTGSPPAGAALACLPDVAERLVLGASPGDVSGAVSTRGMSRVAAARTAMAGSPAEAAWAARAERWERVGTVALTALLAVLVIVQVALTAQGGGSPILLGVGIALLGLLGARELRRRASS